MKTNKNKAYIIILLIAALGAVYIVYRSYTRPELPRVKIKPIPSQELITLYFYDPNTDTLKPEQRMVLTTTDILYKCRMIISELERGSMTGLTTPIPTDVKVNNANWQGQGVLHIDLSDNIISETPEGSSAEITTIYAIVNSLAKNINGLNAVQITINGKRLETLKTHIDIAQPIFPDYTK